MADIGIAHVTNAVQGLSVLNPPTPVSPPATKAVTAAAPAATVTSASAASASTPAPKPAASHHGGGGGGASSSDTQELLTDTYTTTVGGVSYTGSVQQEPGGGFVASVPNLPGASARGATLQAAENNLGTLIDALA